MLDLKSVFVVENTTQISKFKGAVMRENNIVATIRENEVTGFNRHAPIYLQRTQNFSQWLEDRGADLNRSFMRTILSHLRLPLLNVTHAVKSVHAVSLTDSFWIMAESETLQYADVMFKSDSYSKAALQGDPDIFELPRLNTPEITNIGSFNKGWRRKNNKWVLYKAGKPLEIFSELFTAKLAIALDLDAVRYYVDNGFMVCANFVEDGWCFEPAKALIWEDTSYKLNVKVMGKLGTLKKYMDLIFMDALVRNGDRHEFNYGVLTSRTGIIKMAPNFDNNMALFWNGVPTKLSRKDGLVADFIDVYREVGYTLPVVTDTLLRKVFRETIKECPVDVREDTVVEFCMNAYVQMSGAKSNSSDARTKPMVKAGVTATNYGKRIGADLNERQKTILKKISINGITRAKYAEIYKVSTSTAAEDLDELVRLGDFRCAKEKSGAYRYFKVTV